jgi:hypothetical protein
MAAQELMKLIATLSQEQQAAVEEFVRYLKEKQATNTDFRAALDCFVREHPELLRRLAQ